MPHRLRVLSHQLNERVATRLPHDVRMILPFRLSRQNGTNVGPHEVPCGEDVLSVGYSSQLAVMVLLSCPHSADAIWLKLLLSEVGCGGGGVGR
jgi:hypothetical protein